MPISNLKTKPTVGSKPNIYQDRLGTKMGESDTERRALKDYVLSAPVALSSFDMIADGGAENYLLF
jgi:hypothetical protein